MLKGYIANFVLKMFMLGMLKTMLKTDVELAKKPPSQFTVRVEIKWQRSEN